MHVDKPQAFPLQPIALDEFEHCIVAHPVNGRQGREKIENSGPIAQMAAGDFPDDERVA